MIGFEIMSAQAWNKSPKARLKKGLRNKPSNSHEPLDDIPKYRLKTRVQFTLQKADNVIKEFVLKENTQSPPIRKVGYFLIIVHQLFLINWFTIRKENLSPNERNIDSSAN